MRDQGGPEPCGAAKKHGGVCGRMVLEPPCFQHTDDGIKPYKFTDEKRQDYLDMLREGKNRNAAASSVGISRVTVRDHIIDDPEFAEACKVAESDGIAEVEDVLRETALSGNTTALIFYLQNRAPDRWQDRRASAKLGVQVNALNADGNALGQVQPITIQVVGNLGDYDPPGIVDGAFAPDDYADNSDAANPRLGAPDC